MKSRGKQKYARLKHFYSLSRYSFINGSNHVDIMVEISNRKIAIKLKEEEEEEEFNRNAVTILIDVVRKTKFSIKR